MNPKNRVIALLALLVLGCGVSEAELVNLEETFESSEEDYRLCVRKAVTADDQIRRLHATMEVVSESSDMVADMQEEIGRQEVIRDEGTTCIAGWEETARRDASSAGLGNKITGTIKVSWSYDEEKNLWTVTRFQKVPERFTDTLECNGLVCNFSD